MTDETEVLDLHGERCPNTFVYTKIKLEDMAYSGGGVLKVLLDHPPAVENIPRSLKEEKIKYEVLSIVNTSGNNYEVLIKAPSVKG